MPIINVIITLVIIGVVMYLINNYVPMAAPIKTIIMIVVVLCVCIWLLNIFGIANYTVPRR